VEHLVTDHQITDPSPPAAAVTPDALLDVRVRLCAELGRARLPLARVVGLAPGALVDLDRAPDDPVDVYVNGLHYGTGRLLVADGEWALRIEQLNPNPAVVEQPSKTAEVPQTPAD
jgi:flagellar motor switch protein FliN/FliY